MFKLLSVAVRYMSLEMGLTYVFFRAWSWAVYLQVQRLSACSGLEMGLTYVTTCSFWPGAGPYTFEFTDVFLFWPGDRPYLSTCSFWPGAGPYTYKFNDCLRVLAWRWALPTCSFWPGAGPYTYTCSGLEAVYLLAVSEKEEGEEQAKQV